ncbi:universal stress protein [Gephyromycinifex aptenodytis]|uniref:universal stress protein n=1 Tax=Gephyromycinifex aptenodytis TaxID=2716227 RepID=UPI0014454CFE|nr:universal stress protein [Gephyromycinifex aptenodytis]
MVKERWAAEARTSAVVPDVVAGLLAGATTSAVAKAAVREALARGARVRFLQVMRLGVSEQERADSEERTFAAALKAIREAPRVPVTFEAAEGEPGRVLVDRSIDASVLVVGTDDPLLPASVAAYCLEHAACDVLTVRPSRAKMAG